MNDPAQGLAQICGIEISTYHFSFIKGTDCFKSACIQLTFAFFKALTRSFPPCTAISLFLLKNLTCNFAPIKDNQLAIIVKCKFPDTLKLLSLTVPTIRSMYAFFSSASLPCSVVCYFAHTRDNHFPIAPSGLYSIC